jgi:tetratricopeptide (TPR) repeat protein
MKKRRLNKAWPLAIFAMALALRIWNVADIGKEFYANALSDASTYQVWASKLSNGLDYGEPVFQMGPLYPYFLAAALALGIDFYSVLFIQAFFGALVAVMIFFISRSLYNNKAGIISGIAAALYAPLIFYDGLLLSESLQIFLVTAALLILTPNSKRNSMPAIAMAGFIIGLASLGRATILFFAAAIVIYWLIGYLRHKRKRGDRPDLAKLVVFSSAVLVGISPATIHNISKGDFVLISSNTGINFYIGNNANSNGVYEEPKGLDLFSDFSGRRIAEKRIGHALKSSDVSSFWTGQAFNDIKADPVRFVSGLARKVWLYFWHFDIAQAESIHIQKRFSALFNIPLFGFGVVFVFGVSGLLSHNTDERRWILILIFMSNFIGVALFFVLSRFKLIGAIPLLVASGAGVMMLAESIIRRDLKRLSLAAAFGVVCLLILFLPRPMDRRQKNALVYNNVGVYYYFKGNYGEAEKWYREAADISGNGAESMNNIGTVFYARNNLDSAYYYFQQSIYSDPLSDKTLLNLGRISMMLGQPDSARYYYLRARQAAPYGTSADQALAELDRIAARDTSGAHAVSQSFDALYERAQRFAGMGRYDQAEALYLAALEFRDDDIAALNNLGFAFQAQKKFSDAARVFEQVLRLSPDNAVAYNNLAGTLFQIGKVDSAIVLWERAIKLDPANAQFAKNLEFARKQR